MNAARGTEQYGHPAPAGGLGWGLVLTALAALLLRHWQDGSLALYVHPGYTPYLVSTAIALLVLAAAQVWRFVLHGRLLRDERSGGVGWAGAVLAVAVLVAALVPARPLGAAAAAAQAGQQPGDVPLPALRPLTDETASWTLLEWSQALRGGIRHERLVGRRVSVVGFVYRQRNASPSGEFLVTRFVVRCCAADGFAVSLPVRHEQADAFPLDSWVRVDGVLRSTGAAGALFVEADTLTSVPEPTTPYLSPS